MPGDGYSGAQGYLGKSIIPAPQQIIVAADVATVSFTGLNGELDGTYEIEGHIQNNGTANTIYTLRPNGVTANQEGIRVLFDASTNLGALTDLRLVSKNQTSAGIAYFKSWFTTMSGRHRHLISFGRWKNQSGVANSERNDCVWQDTTTLITSLDIVGSVANSIGAGSRFTLRKLGNPLL